MKQTRFYSALKVYHFQDKAPLMHMLGLVLASTPKRTMFSRITVDDT